MTTAFTGIRKSLAALHDMRDSQLETTLLRMSRPPQILLHPSHHPSELHRAGSQGFLRGSEGDAGGIVGIPITEWSWLKASLPSSRGGINLRSASLHAPAAYLASASCSQELVGKMLGCPSGCSPPHRVGSRCSLRFRLTTILAGLGGHQCAPAPALPLLAIDKATHQRLLSSAPSTRSRALVHFSALPHAGDWLNGVPSTALGLHLQGQEFRCFLRYWLGVPLHSTNYCFPECSSTADPFGDHQVGCGGNGDRIARHNAIRDILFLAARSAALAPTREAPSVVPDSRSRSADILLPTWSRGRPAALDVTAAPQGWNSFQSCRRLWEDWPRTPSPPFDASGRPWHRESPPRTPPPAGNTFFTEWRLPCGGAMHAYGCIASPLFPPLWTE